MDLPVTALPEGNETILIVEDEKSILAIAKAALCARGYQVLTETNGLRALELASKYPEEIHLLFTDIVMPKMGGMELAGKLSMIRRTLKVMYTSGYTEDSVVNHDGMETGSEFLQKPYSIKDLAGKVRQLLDAR